MRYQNIKSIFIHLRFGFSVFLLPVFLFAYSQSIHQDIFNTLYIFIILHVFIYPSSNGYNSYMDKDTGSIGGIKDPQKVPESMFLVTVIIDIAGLFFCYTLLDSTIAFLVLIYIIISRAYSYRGIRLKKYPIIGFLTVAIFQGALVYFITMFAINPNLSFNTQLYIGMFLSSLMISAGYPLTQIYQHQQDIQDGVKTISYKLGIKGTFLFSLSLLTLFTILLLFYFWQYNQNIWFGLMFILYTIPVSSYFAFWMKITFKDPGNADYDHTMKMNKISSLCMNLFFISLIILELI